MKEEKVLIEKFKGFDIYYDKDKERFIANKPKLDIHFESSRLWEIKRNIQETQTEEINKEFLIRSGYFNEQIAKIHLLTKNKETEKCKYKILEDTTEGYDSDRIMNNEDIPKTYPLSKENLALYDKVKELSKEIEKVENKQRELVNKLK